MANIKIKKGDLVKVLLGKDRNKTGKILSVLTAKNRVLVEGVNLYKKHVRPKRQGEKGQIVELPRSLAIANVALVCGSCGKAVRVGYRLEKDKKVRFCKKCQAII